MLFRSIVFINVSHEYGLFRREGDNLIMRKSIALLDALTTTNFRFKHLDDRVLSIKYEEIIHPGQKMCIRREGMPNLSDNLVKGDLIIVFDVVFPQSIEKERSKYLVKILPPIKKQIWDIQMESILEKDISHVIMEPYQDDSKYDTRYENMKNQSNNPSNNPSNNIPEDDDVFNKFCNEASNTQECHVQ